MTLLGNTGDHCIQCREIAQWTHNGDPYAPAETLYHLDCSCLICRSCLTTSWAVNAPSNTILCPFCREPAGFPTPSALDLASSPRDIIEEAQTLMQNKDIAESPMGVELSDAKLYLNELYEMALDQVLNPTDLGSPRYPNPSKGNSANMFFAALYTRFDPGPVSTAALSTTAASQRFVVRPVGLENEFRALIQKALFSFTRQYYAMALLCMRAHFQAQEKMPETLELAKEEIPEIRKLGELWDEFAGMWVALLALRHQARFVEKERK